MESDKVVAWFQVAGLVGVLGGLVFVGLQLRQDREIAVIDGMADAGGALLYWAELVAEHPHVWVKGVSGEDLSSEETAAFRALARALDFRYFMVWQRNKRITGSDELAGQFVREAAFDIHRSPGLSRFWAQHQERMNRIGIVGTPGEEWMTAVNQPCRHRRDG